MNAFLVLMYLQVFIAADGKRKKYARELAALGEKLKNIKPKETEEDKKIKEVLRTKGKNKKNDADENKEPKKTR